MPIHHKFKIKPLPIALLLLPMFGSGYALAQASTGGVSGIEEVVVTAEHREASLQETELAITALTAKTIEDLGISNGKDLGSFVPNVHIQPLGGTALGFSPVIRGVGSGEVYVTFDPTAGLYIDDVLIPKNPGGLLDILDLERVEVLRGPQGTLYGRNTIAGAMNFITKKPTDEFEGSARVTLGSANQRDYRGVLNVPLLPADSQLGALNLRVSAAALNRDGLVENDLPGAPVSEFDTVDREILNTQLLWQPTDLLEVRYGYDRTRIDEVPDLQYVTTINPNHPVGRLVAPYSEEQDHRPTSTLSDFDMRARGEVDGHGLNISYELADNLTLRSITGYRQTWSGGVNEDNVPFPLIQTADDQSNDSLTQEFRLLGTALADRLDYSVGVFYMEEEGDVTFGLDVFGNPISKTSAEFENSNWAIYGQGTYNLTDQWSLTGGLRYTEEDREMTKREGTLPNVQYPKASGNFNNVSPMMSLGYAWNDDINSYFKVSHGYQSGGFNVRDVSPVAFVTGFDEESLMAYELGIKATSSDQRFRTNVALWFSDYDDKRVNNFVPEIASNVIRNAGVVEIYGIEVEFLANLTDALQLGINYGYTHPEYVEYDDGRGNDLSKVTLFPFTPEDTVTTSVSYLVPGIDFGALTARVDWSHRDGHRFLTISPERNSAKTTDLVNVRLTLDELAGPGDTSLRVSAWIKNLTDEDYWELGANVYSAFGFDINGYGDPRLFGVDMEVKF